MKPVARRWHDAVIERDQKCQKCGRTEGLTVHHILPKSVIPEARLSVNNGIALCFLCHDKYHKKYGLMADGRAEIDEFLQGMSETRCKYCRHTGGAHDVLLNDFCYEKQQWTYDLPDEEIEDCTEYTDRPSLEEECAEIEEEV